MGSWSSHQAKWPRWSGLLPSQLPSGPRLQQHQRASLRKRPPDKGLINRPSPSAAAAAGKATGQRRRRLQNQRESDAESGLQGPKQIARARVWFPKVLNTQPGRLRGGSLGLRSRLPCILQGPAVCPAQLRSLGRQPRIKRMETQLRELMTHRRQTTTSDGLGQA